MEAADIDDLSGLLAQTENDRRSEQTSTSEDDHDLAHQRHQEDEEHEKDPPIAAIEPRVSLESDHQVRSAPLSAIRAVFYQGCLRCIVAMIGYDWTTFLTLLSVFGPNENLLLRFQSVLL